MTDGSDSVLYLYGTQTGNCRQVALEGAEKATALGFSARAVGMEDFKQIDFADEPILVMICSSTGNGDAPDNADRFCRYVKRPKTPSVFATTRFTVCALGDSNYELFCETGKQLDKHIERLGGERFLKRCDVDEVDGLETHLDPWFERLADALRRLKTQPRRAAPDPAAAPEPTAQSSATKAGQPEVAAAATAPGPAGSTSGAGSDPLHAAVMARLMAQAAGGPAAGDDEEEDALGASAANPLSAPVVAARWLTAHPDAQAGTSLGGSGTEGTRRVLHCEIDVSGGGAAMQFVPGDALGLLPENEEGQVSAILGCLGLGPDSPLPAFAAQGAPPHLRGVPTVREALSTKLDIGSVSVWPPLPLVRLLLEAARQKQPGSASASASGAAPGSDERGTAALRRERFVEALRDVAAGGAAGRAAHAALQRERPSLAELLSRLGCAPRADALLDVLPPLAPRYYSIANAAAADPGRAHLCLSIVEYSTRCPADGSRLPRRGVASGFLCRACAPLLAAAGAAAGGAAANGHAAAVRVLVFRRPPSGNELRLPPSPTTPILLVGPGTGLAPFRSFLQHRKYSAPRSKLGPCHLFFGCRSERVDFLYADELRPMSSSGAISLHTAFSRDGEASSAGTWRGARLHVPYVQDRIEERAREVVELLFEKDGRLYVCGDGQAMAGDVHAALLRVACASLGVTTEEAEARLERLAKEGRYCREIWN